MATDKTFMTGELPVSRQIRRGGTTGELHDFANVASIEGRRNDAGHGRGFLNPGNVNTKTNITTSGPREIGGGRGVQNPPNVDPNAPLPHNDSGKSETANQSEVIKLDFEPNILDNYDAVTYHFKLFMTSTDVSREGTFLNPSNQVIIAESGVSDLTIDKVEMNAIAVPSIESGTGTQTTLKFEIVEPGGAGLLDKMFYESVLLGIGNWFVMPCYLQLSFKGRNPNTSNADNDGQPGSIGNISWVWPLKLTNSKANVTHVGTRYEFEAIVFNELAQSNSYFSVQHSVTLNEIKTFGDAMRALEKKLNDDQFIKLTNNYSQVDTYRIVVDGILDTTQIIPTEDNKNSYRTGDFEILKDKTATFGSGTSIDKIVDALLANTERYQVATTGAQNQTAGANPGTINQTINKMKKFWRVTTETRPIVFDYKRQDNAVEIVIFVFEYDLGANPASPTNTGGTPGTIQASKEQLNEYIHNKILKKKYNYMFTGLNDQVITFDLNMNFSFAAALSRFGGVYYESAGKDIGPVLQKNAEDELKITEQVRKVISMQNNASQTKNQAELQKLIKETTDAVDNSQLSDEQKKTYTALMLTTKPEDRLALTRRAAGLQKGIQGAATNAAGDIAGVPTEITDKDRVYNAAKRRATEIASPSDSNLKFISDLDINKPEVQQAYKEFITTSKGKLRPIPFREAPQESSVGSGKESNSDSGKNKIASLFSTALYSSLDASLLHIKLTIKGDPYWLFPQPISGEQRFQFLSDFKGKDEIKAIEFLKFAHKKEKPNSVNLFGTDNFIIIRFRTPRIYNEVTNPTNPDPFTEVQAFTGVYRVITLISKFEMGKFTQELTCLLDPVIDTTDLINRIEADAKKLDVPATPERLTGKLLQPTAIGTQKLMGSLGTKIDDVKAAAQATKNQVAGVADTFRNAKGQVVDAGKTLIGKAKETALSNIPPMPTKDLVLQASKYIPNKPNITG
jgi:hypothetical protein